MKKLLVTAVLVLLLPLTVMVQSRGDRLVGTYGFKLQPSKIDTTKIQRKVIQAEHKAKVEKAKKLTEEKCSDNKCTFKQILKAIFLGGKFPWETDKDYQLRKQMECTPAGQPFK